MAKKKAEIKEKITALYCRLSVEDIKDDNDKRRKYKRGKFLAYIWLGSIGLLFAGAMCFIPRVRP